MSEIDADGYVAAGQFRKTSHMRHELGEFRVFGQTLLRLPVYFPA